MNLFRALWQTIACLLTFAGIMYLCLTMNVPRTMIMTVSISLGFVLAIMVSLVWDNYLKSRQSSEDEV